MADMENSGMLSQSDLDALIASAGGEESAESENFFGSMAESETEEFETEGLESEPIPAPRAAAPPPSAKSPAMGGLVDLPNFAPAAAAPARAKRASAAG